MADNLLEVVVKNTLDPEVRHPGQTTTKIIQPIFRNYTTRNKGFAAHLEGVKGQIETYLEKKGSKRPLNILLAAPPGTGKSFLIKQLMRWIVDNYDGKAQGKDEKKKREFDLTFEEIYVSSLQSASELHDMFHRVQSANLDHQKKLPVVFFDEIDSQQDGKCHYAKFLAPMWDGTFYVGKERFFLGRSVFCFAGSTLSLDKKSDEIVTGPGNLSYDDYFDKWFNELNAYKADFAKDKLPDFLSRIDATIAIPPICAAMLGGSLDDEYEDLACMLIRDEFPGVKVIGSVALAAVRETLKTEGVRAAAKIVFSSKNDGDRFVFHHLPQNVKNRIKKAAWFDPTNIDADEKDKQYIFIEIAKSLWDQELEKKREAADAAEKQPAAAGSTARPTPAPPTPALPAPKKRTPRARGKSAAPTRRSR